MSKKADKSIKLVIDTEFTAKPEQPLTLLTTQVKFRGEDQFKQPLKHIYASRELQRFYDNLSENPFMTRVDDDLVHFPVLQYLRDNSHTVIALNEDEFNEFINVNKIDKSKKKTKPNNLILKSLGLDLSDSGIKDLSLEGYQLPADKIQNIELMAQFAQAEHGTIFAQDSWYFEEYIKPLCKEGVKYPQFQNKHGVMPKACLRDKARLTVARYYEKYDHNFSITRPQCKWLSGFIVPYLVDDKLVVISYFDTKAIFKSLKNAMQRANRARVLNFKTTFERDRNKTDSHNHISKIEDAFYNRMNGVSINDAVNYAVCADLEVDFIWDDLNEQNRIDDPLLTMQKSHGKNIEQHFFSKIHSIQNLDNPHNLIEYSEKSGRYVQCTETVEKIEIVDKMGSAKNIKADTDDFADEHRSLAKVLGGRAFNNHPLLQKTPRLNKQSCDNNFVADTDISGAYANSITKNVLYIGKPHIRNYGKQPRTLKTFLETPLYESLYHCDVSDLKNSFIAEISIDNLSFKLDYFASRMNQNDPSYDEKKELLVTMRNYDVGVKDLSHMPKVDPLLKYFLHNVTNGRITAWDIDFLLNTRLMTDKQKAELLNKIKVHKLAYHPTEKLVSLDTYTKTSIQVRDKTKIFCVIDLGELYVKPNIEKRKKVKNDMKNYSKDDEQYKILNSLQDFYKLLNNGLYGLLCSDLFNVASVITANNITAKCRLQVFAMEKCLLLSQAITDGGTSLFYVPDFINGQFTFDSLISHYKYKTTKKNSYNRLKPNQNFKFKWLIDVFDLQVFEDDNKVITFKYKGDIYSYSEFCDLIAKKQVEHILESFGNVKGLEGLNLELKGLFKHYTTFGTAHYYLKFFGNDDERDIYKIRGQRDTPHLTIDGEKITYQLNYWFYLMREICFNADAVKLPLIQCDEKLVKIGDIRDKNTLSLINEQRYKPSLPCTTTLSPFTFHSYEQYKSWQKQHEKDKTIHGVSIERFFTNSNDGTLKLSDKIHLRASIEFLDYTISKGLFYKDAVTVDNVNEAREYFGLHKLTKKVFSELKKASHPLKALYTALKDKLQKREIQLEVTE